MRLAFIVNPGSGGKRGLKVWQKLERILKAKQYEYSIYMTDVLEDASRIAGELTNCEDNEPITIVVIGGDGTVNEVLNGMNISDTVTLGYIPTGSGNDLAKGMQLTKNPVRGLRRILRAKEIKHIDYGILTYGDEGQLHRRFIVSSGIGYDAAITQAVQANGSKKRMSKIRAAALAYTLVGIRELIHMRTSSGYIILDQKNRYEFGHIFFISSHQTPYEGGGYRFAPKASNTDGKLTLCIIHAHSRRKLASILLSSRFGNHLKYAGVRCYDCNEVQIHTDKPMAVHTDGESCYMQKDIRLQCISGQLRFITR